MSEFIISSEQLEWLIEGIEHNTGRKINKVVCDGAELSEIVRCRDCKHYDPNDEPSEVYPDRYWCDRLTVYMPPDGFCSFGKRKVVCE